ncbi:unnamed protein product [Hymenolepis diminuta]|uniref:Nitro_FeMo-Co domain-containing protein n=1 Tax=Hymenolepis diminuta TaxID=6216 RepID=A0A0R3SLE5_HYMDI|nr:unnamed protein product [Hymenolepis diminuta]
MARTARKTARKQSIPSSSMSSSSEAKRHCFESQERLATIGSIENATQVYILNPECFKVEIELQLPGRECMNIFTFKDELVFIDVRRSKNEPGSRRVDLMDSSTGQGSSLLNMMNAKCLPVGVATENEIYVFNIEVLLEYANCLSKEVYEAALGRFWRLGHWWNWKERITSPLHRVADAAVW